MVAGTVIGNIVVLVCTSSCKTRCNMVMGLYRLKESHHPAKFCEHGHCGNGEIMVLACHVILQDHVIMESVM